MKPSLFSAGVSALLLLSGVPSLADEGDKPLVFVPVLPYEWLFERIGGDWIEVEAIVGEGEDPHSYSPTPKQVVRMSQANLLFTGHLGFEGNFYVKLGDGDTAPREYDLLEGLDLLEGSCEICLSAKKGEEEANHSHEGLKDPHVWLAPNMLVRQGERIGEILKRHLPSAASPEIDANLEQLRADVARVDEELREVLEPLKGRSFYVYHGAFAYFAEAYGMEQKAIETLGRGPTPRQLVEIAKLAAAEKVRLVFVQPQFDRSSAVSLADTIDGTVQELDPLERDVLANLRSIAEAIRQLR